MTLSYYYYLPLKISFCRLFIFISFVFSIFMFRPTQRLFSDQFLYHVIAHVKSKKCHPEFNVLQSPSHSSLDSYRILYRPTFRITTNITLFLMVPPPFWLTGHISTKYPANPKSHGTGQKQTPTCLSFGDDEGQGLPVVKGND